VHSRNGSENAPPPTAIDNHSKETAAPEATSKLIDKDNKARPSSSEENFV